MASQHPLRLYFLPLHGGLYPGLAHARWQNLRVRLHQPALPFSPIHMANTLSLATFPPAAGLNSKTSTCSTTPKTAA